MEYESTLNVVSRSLDDVQKVFGLLTEKYSRMSAWVWRCVRSFDEMDRSYVQMEIDRIPYWTPEDPECEKFMEKAAGILGKDGFALLTFRNSVSPDYADFKVTTSGGECRSAYDQEDNKSVMMSLKNSYGQELADILFKSKDGHKELWSRDRRTEPFMPYRPEKKTARTHEQVMRDDYLYGKSEEAVDAYKAQRAKDFEDILKILREKYSVEKASSLAQIEKEVDLKSFSGMNYWSAVKNYISDEYGVTPAVYFRNEGIIGKKESTKTVSTLPKTEPLKKTEPGNTADTAKNTGPVNKTESAPEGQKKKTAKQKKENPLISFMRQATDAYGIELEDIVPEDDNLWQLDDLPDPEPDELTEDEKKLVRYVEKEVKELKKKFGGKPKFASYAELKKEAPEGDWKWDEDVIKKYLHTTPAAYYKEAGLIRSGSAKEQLIEQPAAKKKTAKATKTESPVPAETEPEKKEPAAVKAPAKKEPKKTEPAPEEKPEKKEPAAAKAPAKKEPAKKAAAPKPPKPEPEPIITEDGVLITRNPDRIECNEFSNKKELKHVIIPEGIREIDTHAFAHSGIESVVFPKSLRVIGTNAFFDCAGLKTVRLNEGLEEIKEFAFEKTPALTDAYLPDSLKVLAKNAFAKGYAEFTDSPTTLHMSETVARRLQDVLDSNPDSWRFAAAGYVINGERYALIELYFRHMEAREWGERVAAEHAWKIREREEAAERAAEKARQEVTAARIRAEQQKEAARRELRSRILRLEQERDGLRGLFAGLKRKKIQARIDELKEQLKKI